jgi:hypothetical protein
VIAFDMVILCLLLSFVKVTVCAGLLNPRVSVPKLMDVGLTLTFAFATLAKENRIVTAAAIVIALLLLLPGMCILIPSSSNAFDPERDASAKLFGFQEVFVVCFSKPLPACSQIR